MAPAFSFALAAVVIVAIAALTTYAVARLALAKARPADIPEVLAALAQLLSHFSVLVPHQAMFAPSVW